MLMEDVLGWCRLLLTFHNPHTPIITACSHGAKQLDRRTYEATRMSYTLLAAELASKI